jgi:hypothetical protein
MARIFDICCALLIAGLALAGLLSGCTSDDPNEVGSGLTSISLDETLVALPLREVTQFSALDIEDDKVAFKHHQALYLGSQAGNASAILVNFDFDDIFSEEFPDTLFTPGKIQTVKFGLQMLKFYGNPRLEISGTDTTTFPVPTIVYRVSELAGGAPFDTTLTAPIPLPDRELAFIQEGTDASQPLLSLDKNLFLSWVATGGIRGFIVEAGPGSDPGLIGYGSRNLRYFSQIDDVGVGTVVAPRFVVNFGDEEINFLLPPMADISTFNDLTTPPTDGAGTILLRTSLRSYPALLFDFTGLPPEAYINRAVLRLTSDTAVSFGNLTTLVVSELDSIYFTEPAGQMTLSQVGARVYQTSGLTNVDPYRVVTMDFDVTQYVQRRVNRVYSGTRGLIVTADEDFFSSFDLNVTDPDFYFNEFHFLGTAAADSLWPHLRVTYSTTGGLEGGNP